MKIVKSNGDLQWVTAKGSPPDGGIQVARVDNSTILIGSARISGEPVLTYTQTEWDAFLKGMRQGDFDDLLDDTEGRSAQDKTLALESATAAARLSAKFAGRKYEHLREAWLADLVYACDEGKLTFNFAFSTAVGYMIAALRIRASDFRKICWRMLRFVVASVARTHLAICLILGFWIGKVFIDQGFDGVTADVVNFGLAWTVLGTAARDARRRLPKSLDSNKDSKPSKPNTDNAVSASKKKTDSADVEELSGSRLSHPQCWWL